MAENYRLELARVGLNTNNSIKGYLFVYHGEELLGAFSTMERGHGFVYLKIGEYEMKHSKKGTKRDGQDVLCLRPTDERVRSILIHDAKTRRPSSLAGCIAPFFLGAEAYGPSSAKAMDSLWEMLGGYEYGKRGVSLVVLTNVAGDTRTKEEWIDEWAKRRSHHR